jgi:hypothetical protein
VIQLSATTPTTVSAVLSCSFRVPSLDALALERACRDRGRLLRSLVVQFLERFSARLGRGVPRLRTLPEVDTHPGQLRDGVDTLLRQ